MTRSSAFSIRAGVSPAFYGAVREQVNALAKYLQRELAGSQYGSPTEAESAMPSLSAIARGHTGYELPPSETGTIRYRPATLSASCCYY
jgi:hypothetical protein